MKHLFAIWAVIAFVRPSWADDKEDLASAIRKLSDARNYSFKGQQKTDLPALGAFGAGGGGPQENKYEGQVDAREGTHILTEAQEIVRIGDKTAIRPRGDWRVLDENPAGGGGRNLGRMMGQLGGLRPPRAPHEELKDLASKLERASRDGKKETVGETECDVYSFDLSEDGAKGLFPMGGMMGRLGGGNADVKFRGKGKGWVADGLLVKLETVATLSASFNGNDFDVSTTRTVSIHDVGKTRVEIPEDAKKAIKAKSE
ncbi:MAG TPA: hypothetical protein VEN81_10630 [Planctomycetota bacterium]|nr:hypothetical protein [Planctomycetota bacterium]